jgi:hypothetical protein
MTDGPVAVATRGKGALNLIQRAGAIGVRYGLGPTRMERRLEAVLQAVRDFGCGATLPITAAAVERNPAVVARFASEGIEFAGHGYYHVDHAALAGTDQVRWLGRARKVLQDQGVPAHGFRAPYLRWNDETVHAVRANGFMYDTSPAMNWPVEPARETPAYRRALEFYGATAASARPVLPWIEDGLVRIPYCLPDDEAVVDRLGLNEEEIAELWLSMLRRTYERGELLTLGIHPERIAPCYRGIAAVLDSAHAARPGVWMARLEEVALWWKQRDTAQVTVEEEEPGSIRVNIEGPPGLTLLARCLTVPHGADGGGGYRALTVSRLSLATAARPVIGVHPSTPASLSESLRSEECLVEIGEHAHRYAYYVRRSSFSSGDEAENHEGDREGAFPPPATRSVAERSARRAESDGRCRRVDHLGLRLPFPGSVGRRGGEAMKVGGSARTMASVPSIRRGPTPPLRLSEDA